MIRAVVFDMDGVLIDSEPLWRQAEIAGVAEVGLALTEEQCLETQGLRMDEVVRLWYERSPWPDPDHPRLVARVIEAVEALVGTSGLAMAGVDHAVTLARGLGLRLALASTSPARLIAATLRRLGLEEAFEVANSAEDETHGKPHPAVFLRTAADLGVDPTECVVIEDSVNGMVAAAAARMRCVVVPAAPDPRYALAEVCLPSLEALTAEHLLGPPPP